ncbi:hypothetical protein EVAR_61569_1 [Eumeta japonica]|uniref:Uncharacterized protein n=1 Tax=Eumeta variegata TaxID=151549 RepID=A0A4C1YQZ3_EUMVA|nr:hypothetical protein EVAR_61569_1 [Eumeta japonica]
MEHSPVFSFADRLTISQERRLANLGRRNNTSNTTCLLKCRTSLPICRHVCRRPTRARAVMRGRRQVEGLRRLVLDEGREAQLKLDTQPTAGGRTLVDADRIKAARIGDPRWRRSDRARLPTADQAIHASDGSSQGSTCQRAASFNLLVLSRGL